MGRKTAKILNGSRKGVVNQDRVGSEGKTNGEEKFQREQRGRGLT